MVWRCVWVFAFRYPDISRSLSHAHFWSKQILEQIVPSKNDALHAYSVSLVRCSRSSKCYFTVPLKKILIQFRLCFGTKNNVTEQGCSVYFSLHKQVSRYSIKQESRNHKMWRHHVKEREYGTHVKPSRPSYQIRTRNLDSFWFHPDGDLVVIRQLR